MSKKSIEVKVKISDTEMFKNLLGVLQEIICDKTIPTKRRIFYHDKLKNVVGKGYAIEEMSNETV